jgi:hypothetical protein
MPQVGQASCLTLFPYFQEHTPPSWPAVVSKPIPFYPFRKRTSRFPA